LAADYVQASGSTLAFAGKYQGEGFTGSFPGFATRFQFDPKQPTQAKLEVDIPLGAVTISNASYRDELRGSGFLDVARFPKAHFSATQFRALGGNRYATEGNLTLHGISKPVTFFFTWTPGAQPILQGRAIVPRLRFGVGGGQWADTKLIPDEVMVTTRVVFKPR
jgi:polyisoprenoid-binding protein YceI